MIVAGGFACLALVALWVAANRAITIAVLEVEEGKVRVVRGGIAGPVLADIRDVAKRPRIRLATIRIVRSTTSGKQRADVRIAGEVPADQAQRIRNVVGSVPLARLVNSR
jgi:hypothetical protein